jgi:phage terminase large subunit-like protein
VLEALSGVQEPRFRHEPFSVRSSADDAIQLVAEVGMPMDEWQQIALRTMLGERADGSWAAQECGIVVSRQNGKNSVLEARELAGLFLFGEARIVHSAHQAATADEAFKRMRNLIESTPWLDSEVAKILGSPGRQSIRLKSGGEISYRTRTKGGARGFSAPVVIFDEAQELSGEQIAAIVPVTSSFPNRQLVYTGTVLAGASVFRGLVERGRKRIGDALGYCEWSAPEDCESDDPAAWVAANPAIGRRIELDYVRNELETFRAAGAEDKWREERLGIWPESDAVGSVIPVEAWAACFTEWKPDAGQTVEHIGVAVSPDRGWSSVGVAFPRDGRTFVQVVKHEAGTDWVLPYVAGLAERRRPRAVILDQGGPAASLLNGLVAAQLPVRVASTADMKAACAQFVDAVKQKRVEHTGQVPLTEAAHGVRERPVGDAWIYDRRKSGAVVAPIEAVTLAAWGLTPDPKAKEFFVVNLNDYLTDD